MIQAYKHFWVVFEFGVDLAGEDPALELIELDDVIDNDQSLMNCHKFQHVFGLVIHQVGITHILIKHCADYR